MIIKELKFGTCKFLYVSPEVLLSAKDPLRSALLSILPNNETREGGRILVDAWSCKYSKMNFPAGLLWKALLTDLHRAGLSDVSKLFEKGAGMRELGGVGEVTAKVLYRVFGVKTVGDLADLTEEKAVQIQERIKKEGLVRNMAAGKMLALVQSARILVTTALMKVADDDEDDDDGHLLHATEAPETPTWDSYT
jgi:ribosomal protein S13